MLTIIRTSTYSISNNSQGSRWYAQILKLRSEVVPTSMALHCILARSTACEEDHTSQDGIEIRITSCYSRTYYSHYSYYIYNYILSLGIIGSTETSQIKIFKKQVPFTKDSAETISLYLRLALELCSLQI